MSGSGDETPPDSPEKKTIIKEGQDTPIRTNLLAPAVSSVARGRKILYSVQEAPGESLILGDLSNTADASDKSVSSTLDNAFNIFNMMNNNAIPRDSIRNTLELIKNMDQMKNVWGENIVNWAKCGDDRIKSIDCPCCYLCGKKINGKTHMEHKIPSVSAYLNVPNILIGII